MSRFSTPGLSPRFAVAGGRAWGVAKGGPVTLCQGAHTSELQSSINMATRAYKGLSHGSA